MKKIYYILSALFLCVVATSAQEAGKTVVIKTNVGTMKAILYDDVPNHTRTFIERAKRGDFNGTLFTRVLPEFMIQGGAPDSKNAPAGAKCGFGDPSAEIPPENAAAERSDASVSCEASASYCRARICSA